MEADIEKLMSSKSFKELTTAERKEWKDLFTTEEEYDQMRSMFAGLAMIKEEEFEPAAKTKRSLDDLFAETYGRDEAVVAPTFWMKIFPQEKSFFQRPLVQVAAAVLLIVIAVPFFTKTSLLNEQQQLAKEETTKTEERSKEIKMGAPGASESTAPAVNSLNNSVLAPPVAIENKQSEMEDLVVTSTYTEEAVMSSPPPVASTHSDLDFDRPETYGNASVASVKSTSAAEQKGVLDLLTVAF